MKTRLLCCESQDQALNSILRINLIPLIHLMVVIPCRDNFQLRDLVLILIFKSFHSWYQDQTLEINGTPHKSSVLSTFMVIIISNYKIYTPTFHKNTKLTVTVFCNLAMFSIITIFQFCNSEKVKDKRQKRIWSQSCRAELRETGL